MTTPRKLSPEQARWLLVTAEHSRAEAEAILDAYFATLPVDRRVQLQLAKAEFEWTIEQVSEVIRGQHATH